MFVIYIQILMKLLEHKELHKQRHTNLNFSGCFQGDISSMIREMNVLSSSSIISMNEMAKQNRDEKEYCMCICLVRVGRWGDGI
jgi:hypothetical protein